MLPPLNIVLADDDIDDCQFFEDALKRLTSVATLVTVYDGEQLMSLLTSENYILPDVLFLDLNMPRKNGFECLAEIKQHKKLARLPVIVFSTSFDKERVTLLYESGAQYFMRKPAEFTQLKNLIKEALTHIVEDIQLGKRSPVMQPDIANFVLTVQTGTNVAKAGESFY
jgi:CheY-like chemotaxis protein